MEDIFYPSHDGKTKIHAVIWRPEGKARGVVQLIHGMQEYGARYAPFAEYLVSLGYIVCADDHLGHGQSVNSDDDLGYFAKKDAVEVIIADLRSLYKIVKEEQPDIPFYILGHSMGSFFCRAYIARYGSDYDGAIIMGSGFKGRALLNFALFFVRLDALFRGWRHRSKTIEKLAFGSYGKKFSSKLGWLSKDENNVKAYVSDPLCGVPFTNNAYLGLFSVIKLACAKKTILSTPDSLPIFIVSGDDDPVGDYAKGVNKLYNKLKKAKKNVKIKLYMGYRHEILNDRCRGEVFKDISDFLEGLQNG